MKLLLKMLGWLVPLLLIPLFAVAVLAYQSLQSITIDQANTELKKITDNVSHLVATNTERSKNNLDVISNDALIQDYLRATEADRYTLYQAPLLRRFKALQTAYPEYLSLQLHNAQGTKTVSRKSSDRVELSEAMIEFAIKQVTEAVSSAPILLVPESFSQENPLLIVAKRVEGSKHANNPAVKGTLGFLIATLNGNFLKETLDQTALKQTALYVLSNRLGQPILSNQDATTGDLVPMLKAHFRGTSHNAIELPLQDTRYLALRTELLTGVDFYVLKSLSTLTSASEHLTRMVALVSVIVASVAVIVLYFIVTIVITRPLSKLNDATQSIARGELDIHIPVKQADEVGDLARALGDMAKKLKRSTEQIEELAYFDTLTGLPNKVSFFDGVQSLIQQAESSGTMVAVLFFDLDNFKTINDSLGHHYGDELLMSVGGRLRECIRGSDMIQSAHNLQKEVKGSMIARLGGDEFTLALAHIHEPQQASKVAVRILTKLAMPFHLDDNEVFVGASIGIAVYPRDGTTVEALLKHSDIAMYEAKSRGKNNFQYFDQQMNDPINERLALESAMRAAIEHQEFQLYYQPKVPVGNARRYEFEALLRWKHPQKGFVSPAVFIPIAEETGLIQQIGDWIFDTACEQIRRWLDEGYENVCVSVNLSPVQMNFGNPIGVITHSLQKYDVPARHLEVEITESGLMRNEQAATAILAHLKETGISIALDDFGTGYSSLAYLRRFPIDVLKIDRAFVKDVESDPVSTKVLNAVISLAKSLDLAIVAEGVETQAQLDLLEQRGCDLIQGYFYARPTPPKEAMEFFDGHYASQDSQGPETLDNASGLAAAK